MPAFATLDKNSDGKITSDEAPEQMQRGFSFMDANGDGGIDKAEHQAFVEKMKQMQQGGGPPGGGPPGASGGGAQ
jgi:Ca2+-binding EF-hand superfamily protein